MHGGEAPFKSFISILHCPSYREAIDSIISLANGSESFFSPDDFQGNGE